MSPLLVNLSTPNTYAEIGKGEGVDTIIDGERRISTGDGWNYGETWFTFTGSLSAAPDKWFSVHLSGASKNAVIVNERAHGYWYYDSGYYDYRYGYDYGYYGDWYYYHCY
jgi:hypothetical protein